MMSGTNSTTSTTTNRSTTTTAPVTTAPAPGTTTTTSSTAVPNASNNQSLTTERGYDTTGRAGDIDPTTGFAAGGTNMAGTRVTVGNDDVSRNAGVQSNYGRQIQANEYASSAQSVRPLGAGAIAPVGYNNSSQVPLDPAVQVRDDGRLNTDSIYGSKSASRPEAGPGALATGNTGATGDAAPYRAVPTIGPFAPGTVANAGTVSGYSADPNFQPIGAAGTTAAAPLGTGHSIVSMDVPTSQVLGRPVQTNTTNTTNTNTTTPAVVPGSAGRVLLVLSSANPAIYGSSIMHPSTLFSKEKRKSGYYWDEVAIPYQTFVDAGYAVDFCSETGQASVDENSVDSMMSQGKTIYNDKKHPIHEGLQRVGRAADLDSSRYNIVFFAGGHAAAYDLPTAANVQRLAAGVYEQGGVVAAVCHGPAVFKGLRLSNGEYLASGRRITGFSEKGEQKMGLMDQLRQDNISTIPEYVTGAGGNWVEHESNPMAEYVVDDRRVVTGMNPASAGPTAAKAIEIDKQSGGMSRQAAGYGGTTTTTHHTTHHTHHTHPHHHHAGTAGTANTYGTNTYGTTTTSTTDPSYDKTRVPMQDISKDTTYTA